jgi:hydrogenase nickel incorporation protein HypA/HybF
MHEMGIALEIIKIATDSIPANLKNPRVERINLKVGKLAAVVADSLQFCFEVAARDTALEGTLLHIEEIPVTARCTNCGYSWTAIKPVFICEKCDSGLVDLLSGRELDIVSIEVEEGA